MLFSDIINQQTTKSYLLQTMQQQRLSHALLFLAPEGAGGLPLALAFAQYVVCENQHANGACGECDQCKKAAQLIHPDIHYSYPVVNKKSGEKPVSTDYIKEWREFVQEYPYSNVQDWLQFIGAENKQGNITANECQEIIHKLSLKSFESDYKILILWMPEYLGDQGNRLLKLIEEPPAKTLFILVAEQSERILSTILSRIQLIKLAPLQKGDIKNALVERAHLDEQQANRLSNIASGNYREALQLLQHANEDLLALLRTWLNDIFTGNTKALQSWIEEIASAKTGRENQKNLLRYFISLLEQSIRLQYLSVEELQLPEEEVDFAARLNKVADFSKLDQIRQALEDACYHIERNANAKILFHALSIQMQYIFSSRVLPV
jgi:DNA polymerase III subunit delta'